MALHKHRKTGNPTRKIVGRDMAVNRPGTVERKSRSEISPPGRTERLIGRKKKTRGRKKR